MVCVAMDTYITEVVASHAASVNAQVNKLMGIPLQKQSQFVLLRASLAVRMAHLKRTVPWELLARHVGEVESVIHAAVASIFRLQRGLGPTYVLTDVDAALQMRLPLRHGVLQRSGKKGERLKERLEKRRDT